MAEEELIELGITEDVAKKVATQLKDFVPASKLEEVKTENKKLTASLKERDAQIAELKNATDLDELKKEIEELQTENQAKDKEHAKAIEDIKINTAVEAALTTAKAKNSVAVRALLDLEDLSLNRHGEVKGLAEQIKKLSENESTSFLFDDQNKPRNFQGAKPAGSNTDLPPADGDISKMNYEQLSAYMEANPSAQI